MNRIASKFFLMLPLLTVAFFPNSWAADEVPEDPDTPGVKVEDTGGKLEAIEPVFNFGVLRADEVDTVSHTFTFRNSGAGNLLITRVKPSCGCTSAVASATDLAPGQQATLSAAMKPKGKFGETSVTVRMDSNDPANPQQVFTIKGTVLSPWRVIPALVDMGDLGKGEVQERASRIVSQYFEGETHHRITAVRTDSLVVEAATQEFHVANTDPARKFVDVRRPVNIRVTGGDKTGPQSAHVFVSTDDPKSPTQVINVKWNVEGDLSVSTKRVIVLKRGEESRPVNLALKSRSGIPFEVLSIEAKSKGGNSSALVFTPLDSNTPTEKTYRIEVSENVEAGKPNMGDIIILTNHPEQKAVTVPYTASVMATQPRINTSE